MNNLKITATLKSPIVNQPPMFDSLLASSMASIYDQVGRGESKENIDKIDIPLLYNDAGFYYCSNPIYKVNFEWRENWSKQFNVEKLALFMKNPPRSLLNASGPYKKRYSPLHCQNIDFVRWFVVGDKRKIKNVLDKIFAISSRRGIGYGFVEKWTIEEIETDLSIVYNLDNVNYLMKTIPFEYFNTLKDFEVKNFVLDYGSCLFPYWLVDNYTTIVRPQ